MRGRLAVVSDIHGNADALEAVLAEIESDSCDGVICLGDTVGYGASPAKCLTSLIALGPRLLVHIRGNHEEALFNAASFNEMNPIARRAILYTAANLEPVHKTWLARIPGLSEFGPVQCIHDNPIPASNTYLRDPGAAASAFRGVGREFCFVGHTHVPLLFETTRSEPDAEPRLDEVVAHLLHEDEPFHLAAGGRFIVNPGSVGQPRDGDPRASFGVIDLDERTFTLRRVAYDVAAAQAAMHEAGLPDLLADRLAVGA